MSWQLLSAALGLLPRCLTGPTAAPVLKDSFEIQVVRRVPLYVPSRFTCGDADHDGRSELYALGKVNRFWYDHIIEFTDSSSFDTTFLGMEHAINWSLGDADRDGNSDLVVEEGVVLRVLEAEAPAGLPTTAVWVETLFYQGANMNCRITDLDLDSAREIAVRVQEPSWCIRLYECAGDNDYRPRVELPSLGGIPNDFCQTSDLDHDGKPELAVGTTSGHVSFAEAAGDDSMVWSATVELDPAGDLIIEGIAAAPDMDGDQRSEVVAFGVDDHGVGTLAVIEAQANDSFVVVWSTQFPGSYFDHWEVVTGDMDGDSVEEFAVTDGVYLHLYRCTGSDRYEQFWQIYTNKEEVGMYDLDFDGKTELLYRYSESTFVCKYVSLSIAECTLRQLGQVMPTVWRGIMRLPRESPIGATGRGGEAPATTVLLDVTGRTVMALRRGDNDASHLAPGAYFVRITSGSHSITRKVLVVE